MKAQKNCTIGWRDRMISNGCHIFNYQYFIINIFIFCDYCLNEFDTNLLTAGDFDPHKNLTKVGKVSLNKQTSDFIMYNILFDNFVAVINGSCLVKLDIY